MADEGVVYEDNGSAGYDDAGPGIRRLSAAVVIFVKIARRSADVIFTICIRS